MAPELLAHRDKVIIRKRAISIGQDFNLQYDSYLKGEVVFTYGNMTCVCVDGFPHVRSYSISDLIKIS
ncbi:hypothetical protein HYT23_03665 [Candidatus Pacearchaeota archaeon]|nr:hypothetical protein [Candidatus Pacearchaeota archaeon]